MTIEHPSSPERIPALDRTAEIEKQIAATKAGEGVAPERVKLEAEEQLSFKELSEKYPTEASLFSGSRHQTEGWIPFRDYYGHIGSAAPEGTFFLVQDVFGELYVKILSDSSRRAVNNLIGAAFKETAINNPAYGCRVTDRLTSMDEESDAIGRANFNPKP